MYVSFIHSFNLISEKHKKKQKNIKKKNHTREAYVEIIVSSGLWSMC